MWPSPLLPLSFTSAKYIDVFIFIIGNATRYCALNSNPKNNQTKPVWGETDTSDCQYNTSEYMRTKVKTIFNKNSRSDNDCCQKYRRHERHERKIISGNMIWCSFHFARRLVLYLRGTIAPIPNPLKISIPIPQPTH